MCEVLNKLGLDLEDVRLATQSKVQGYPDHKKHPPS
jgi:hypothetical protein